MTAVLAVLAPAYRHLLDPDVCGGRAPWAYGNWTPEKREVEPGHAMHDTQEWACPGCGGSVSASAWTSEDAVKRIEHWHWCPGRKLVLFDSRNPIIGRRGLACAADAAAEALRWKPGVCSPTLALNIEPDTDEESQNSWRIVLNNMGKMARWWPDPGSGGREIPALATLTARVHVGVTSQLLAEAVGIVLVHLGIAERIEVM